MYHRAVNVDTMFETLDGHGVDCLLIGGMNFLLNHEPELTFDVDIWVRDERHNLALLNAALRDMGAAWGHTEAEWTPVEEDADWLESQPMFCLTTRCGALDVYRDVAGLEGRYAECKARAARKRTPTGAPYWSLSDLDMLAAELALPPFERRDARIRALRRALGEPD